MPTIYEYLGLSFFFHSREHLPIHIHIMKGDRVAVAKFEMTNGKLVDIHFEKKRNKKYLTPAELAEARKLLEAKHEIIINRWTDYFIKNKNYKTITITKRIR